MLSRVVRVTAALLPAVFALSCGTPCSSPNDCPIGSHCVIEVSSNSIDGTCRSECSVNDDCASDPSNLTVTICNNEGRCITTPRPPRLRVMDPENDTLLPEGTRTIRLSGEVETAAESVTVTVSPDARGSCLVGLERSVVLQNPEVGSFATLPFIINDVELDPGLTTVTVRAQAGAARKELNHVLEVPCPGCAEIEVEMPQSMASVPALELPRLRGTISPTSVTSAVWRVRGESGDVFDGPLPVVGGVFDMARIPLFAGFNKVEVNVTGVGSGLGESRCSLAVTSGVARERGLRAVLSWDGATSDLDLHVVGPGGRFGDPMSVLSSGSIAPSFGGELTDDFDGFGPETAVIDALPDGVYGVVVEPVFDDRDPGSNAFLRLLYDGRPVMRGALGPQHLTDTPAELWIVGTLRVRDGSATWTYINERIDAFTPPTRSPDAWPEYF